MIPDAGMAAGAGGAAADVEVAVVVTVAEAVVSGFLFPRSEYIAAVTAAPPPALRQAIIAIDFDMVKDGFARVEGFKATKFVAVSRGKGEMTVPGGRVHEGRRGRGCTSCGGWYAVVMCGW